MRLNKYNEDQLRKAIKYFNIDTSHFTGQRWNKGKKIPPRRPIEDYLTNKITITSYKLCRRLLKEKIKKHQCEICGGEEWNGKKIPLELHHINGNNKDNRMENIKLLCPNCHALTDNYRNHK